MTPRENVAGEHSGLHLVCRIKKRRHRGEGHEISQPDITLSSEIAQTCAILCFNLTSLWFMRKKWGVMGGGEKSQLNLTLVQETEREKRL